MTETLALVRRDDFWSDVDSISLIDYGNGIDVAADGWPQAVMREPDLTVDETITLRIKGTSHDDLAMKVQALDAKILQAWRYIHDRADIYGVWLRSKKKNETNTRQALLFDIAGKPLKTLGGPIFDRYAEIIEYGITLTRGHWESDVAAFTTQTVVSTVGSKLNLGTIAGDFKASLAISSFYKTAGSSVAGALNKFWVGLRSTRRGVPANFQPIWELELGALSNDTATTTANDATASGATPKSIRCTFATVTTLAERVRIKTSQVTANTNDQRGSYIVLLRAKTASTLSCLVELSVGFSSAATWIAKDLIPISNTGWAFYELGTITIPVMGRTFQGSNIEGEQTLRLRAQLVSGSGNLDMDCLILIPYDEGFVYCSGGSLLNTNDYNVVADMADGISYALGYISNAPIYNDVVHQVIGGLPVGATVYAILAAQENNLSVLGDTIALQFYYLPHWGTLRGAG